jgi:hypothetical protein
MGPFPLQEGHGVCRREVPTRAQRAVRPRPGERTRGLRRPGAGPSAAKGDPLS